MKLLYGDDYLGNICGANNTLNPKIVAGLAKQNTTPMDHTNRPYQYFLTPFDSTIDPTQKSRICMSQCPQITSLLEKDLICLYQYQSAPSYNLVKTARCFFPYQSSPRLNRCVPDFAINASSIVIDQINNLNGTTTMILNSLYDTWYIMVGGVVASVVLGFLWLFLMRYCAGVAIWTNVISSFLSVAAIAFMMYFTGLQLQATYNSTPLNQRILADVNNYQFLLIMSYILFGVAGLMFFIYLFQFWKHSFSCYYFSRSKQSVYIDASTIIFPNSSSN